MGRPERSAAPSSPQNSAKKRHPSGLAGPRGAPVRFLVVPNPPAPLRPPHRRENASRLTQLSYRTISAGQASILQPFDRKMSAFLQGVSCAPEPRPSRVVDAGPVTAGVQHHPARSSVPESAWFAGPSRIGPGVFERTLYAVPRLGAADATLRLSHPFETSIQTFSYPLESYA